jgi:thiamine biosynthesis protein ThiS
MIIRVNGEEKHFSDAVAGLGELLALLGAAAQRVAVEINGEIIDPALFASTPVQDKDNIEIVSFVGGG